MDFLLLIIIESPEYFICLFPFSGKGDTVNPSFPVHIVARLVSQIILFIYVQCVPIYFILFLHYYKNKEIFNCT